jgi:hypothetical protein
MRVLKVTEQVRTDVKKTRDLDIQRPLRRQQAPQLPKIRERVEQVLEDVGKNDELKTFVPHNSVVE